jgi:hypothetical protein
MSMDYKKSLQRRIARQRAFHASKKPGDLLVYLNRNYASLEGFLNATLFEGPVERLLNPAGIPAMIGEYVRQLRDSYRNVYVTDDDTVPSAMVYWGVGGITAAMTGLEPRFAPDTSWLEPNLSWDQIARLRFDPENRWVRFALHLNQALWAHWEEDFTILPFLHRSPLDAANGIRGTDLFLEMYTDPEKVKRLIDWCADWQIQVERCLAARDGRPHGWGNGVWATWLPEGGVFVNGDPVGLISRAMMPEFEQPYTAKLFTATGGGFFHNHTVGLYQVDQVSRTPGLLVQEFAQDPKCPNLPEVLLGGGRLRDTILAASLNAPIMIENVPAGQLDALLPILKEGRFILSVGCGEGDDPAEALRKVRAASRNA